jgi:sec-independent protein translocase protein TatA
MFGIGGPELVFIFILALLIFGPKRLPQIGRTIGKGMAEFRRASTELQRAVNTELEEPQTPAWRAQPAAAAAAGAPAPVVSAEPPAGTVAADAALDWPAAAEETAAGEASLEVDAAQQAAEPEPEPVAPTHLQ